MNSYRSAGLSVVFALLLVSSVARADQVLIVNSFEKEAEIGDWEIRSGGTKLVEGTGVTHGKKALEITFDPKGKPYPVYVRWSRLVGDWSQYDTLVIDVHNPNSFAVGAGIYIGDDAWRKKSTYWNRHNTYPKLAPGAGQLRIPVHGLFRGEAGGRNKDLKFNIDPRKIVRLDLKFGNRPQQGSIIIDNIRFLKADPRPEGVWAFDFGPADQSVMSAWTPMGRETAYTPERKFGWEGGIPQIMTAARDTTFGPVLTRDFVQCGGCTFRIDVPRARYEVMVIYENCGYWGQEQTRHSIRKITSHGRTVWSEKRPDGRSTALFRFEDVEPVGVDIWNTYMLPEITKPVRFQVDAGIDDGVKLHFEADSPWGSRIAALAIYRVDDPIAKEWTNTQVNVLAKEFRGAAVCLDGPAPKYTPPAAWRDRSLVAWPVLIEEDVTPNSVPARPVSPREIALTADAVRGEYEPVSVAVRPLKDLGKCSPVMSWQGKTLPATVSIVRCGMSRRGSIAYHIRSSHLVTAKDVTMPKDLTRQFIVTVKVPADAKAGRYRAQLALKNEGGRLLLEVPITVTVHDVTLTRETGFLMGMYGLYPPRTLMSTEDRWRYLEETLALMRDYGMNALVEEPGFTVTGWKDGQPQIDFTEADRFFALCRKYGFHRGGIRDHGTNFKGLHGWYEKGKRGRETERRSGLDFETAMMRAFEALDKHARANDWPVLFYKMCDETRVKEVAERQLEFMKLMDRIHKRFPKTIEPLGSYSVNFQTRPTDRNNMLYWHQRFFENLAISNLNNHDETVLTEAKKLGRKVHIYNQGTSCWSFGLYQWSEFQKGVAARWQWHTNILHGYQFFDLDGREPDPAMILYGRNGLYTTIRFERSREGAEDFYLCQTLHDLIQSNTKAGRKPAETKRAEELLTGTTDRVRINQRGKPDWFDPYEFKRKAITAVMEIR